ncbi:MAG: hypothetical protein JXB62_01340 [Pirellulales bacterium]|nr:hypothetical protein [Pirellulales bacterium]
MNDHDDNRTDERVAALFAAVNTDAAVPEPQFLDRLREQSTQVFAAESAQPAQLPVRRRNMFTLAMRGVMVTAAATIAAAAFLWSSISPDDSALAFGKVLDKVAQAETVQLEITRDGKSERAWARRPDQLRIDHADGTYQIARGSKLWRVDEKANRATTQASPYFRADQPGFDLLALVELPQPADRKELLAARPAERVRRDGLDCDVYRMEVPASAGKVAIEAVVDAATGQLRSLETLSWVDRAIRPRVKVKVLAVDQPVDEGLFVVGDTLTEDGRVGKVTDVQGIVSVKPAMHRRFTPVATHMLLKPGDWLRTDNRGANAMAFRLVQRADVTLGPGSLVEVVSPEQLRLSSGELKVVADGKAPLTLIGPGEQKITVAGTQVYRLQKEKLVRVEQAPLWVAGFEGATANESIGSLIANVDGRNVPLTVGYHKVSVDIRDQIARTVIEESFVNHTVSRLEGVFYFPLPQDASISGFGMWIGNELVEADVVEKQRAREIYETILRERRDPGLLEWSGGNIFKARVFPIEGRSEKRIKITYTQVLPLQGDRYRYSYGLQSELLKQHPLRELAIDVKMSSAMPLAGVSSPTHTTRIDRTAHSAHVEFAAQDYTPERDFEVLVETGGERSDVVVIPHRRGEDGYFMVQLTPPAGRDAWQRELLPDGKPLELLILADTSASIDADSRAAQADFLASLLGSLTAEDKFNLAGCDVDCDWVFKQAQPATEKNTTTARQFLADRISLGWTDLDKAFASAAGQCGKQTQVLYIGDGIVTGKDVDPVAFGKRLSRLWQGKATPAHAVALSSSFEPMVLKTIASLGGGSLRQIGGENRPQDVALGLLAEMARPTLRNLKIEFRGLRTARVYPEQLPNLSVGTQQIILGRYLPEEEDQVGEVIVTGTLDEQPVTFRGRVTLPSADAGNSFIPRLWARMHLDALLRQGTSEAIKDEIIALSEEYHIMTPYTSLLVLESDEDRERFKVKRRFQMRDGERFFATGRDNVDYELMQQQIRRAGNWRIGLRHDVLRQLIAMGRNPQLFQPQQYYERYGGRYRGDYSFPASGPMGAGGMGGLGGIGGWGMGGGSLGGISLPGVDMEVAGSVSAWYANGRIAHAIDELAVDKQADLGFEMMGERKRELSFDSAEGLEAFEPMDDWADGDEFFQGRLSDRIAGPADAAEPVSFEGLEELARRPASLSSLRQRSTRGLLELSRKSLGAGSRAFNAPMTAGLFFRESQEQSQYTQWLDTLFPNLPPVPQEEKPIEPKQVWPDDARALAKSLLRTDTLAGLQGGLKIESRSESFDARWDMLTSRSETLMLVSPQAWLVRGGGYGSQTTIQWCNEQERGVLSKAFQLGRTRASEPLDLSKPPLSLEGPLLTPLDRTYHAYRAEVSPQGDDRALLVLRQPSNADYAIRFLIDTARHVVLRIESHQQGAIASTATFGEFVEVAGAWWATRIERTDKEGRRTSLATLQFTPLAAEPFAGEINGQLAGRDHVAFLRVPLVEVNDARRAVQAGKATFDDQMAMVLYFADSQRWQRVMEHLAQAEQLAADKPGLRWVRDALMNVSRRREELRQRFLDEAARIARPTAKGNSEECFLAEYLHGQASGFLEANERMQLLDVLKPVYARQVPHLQRMKLWNQYRVDLLRQTGQADEAMRLQEEMARQHPHDSNLQQQYAQALANAGDHEAAYAWLKRVLTDDAKWHSYEEDSLRNTYTNLLRNQGRYPELVDLLAEWIGRKPENSTAYHQYLAALIQSDRIDEANGLIGRWLEEARTPERLKSDVAARLSAAVSQALGQGYNLYTNRIDERWLEPLAQTALFFARHPSHASTADQIMGHHRFRDSDACRQVRRKVAAIVVAEIETLEPDQVRRLVDWIWPNDPAVEARAWKRIADVLQQRWSNESDLEARHQLAQPLVKILSGRLTPEEHLAFLRRQVQEGPEKYRTAYINQLFDTLLTQPWSAECESEAFSLLPKLSDAEQPAQRLWAQVAALHRLTDAMVQARYDARMAKVEHQEELTRTELRDKQSENLKAARQGFADRLREAMSAAPGQSASWMQAERLYLDVLTGRNLDRAAEDCWEVLGPKPPKPVEEPELQQQLEEVLRDRLLLTLANLAARRNADPELITRLLKYADDGIAADAKDLRWKLLKYQLLIALDRPKDLQQDLRRWLTPDEPDSFWRLSLGYLLAEQGEIPEAIKHFEAVETANELGAAEYRTLADWYMVVDRRDEHERALISVFKRMEEWRLNDWLYQKLRPWQQRQGELPGELDQDVLRVFAALFEKSGSPQNYLSRLRDYYRASRDFRLLAGLADGIVGHTAAWVYPFLQGMDSILREVRDEATADSIVEHLATVRRRARTEVDHRAIDLLEALVERRAAEVLNQPGPHAERALAAMHRAFHREWTPGEPRLMADLLASLGRISHPELAAEQIRQLEVLHQQAAEGTIDRLHIAHRLANGHWSYARQDEAIDLLEAALGEFLATVDGVLPSHANGPLDTFVSYLEQRGHHARAEEALFQRLQHPANVQQTRWFTQRLYQLYEHAIGNDGDVSLGRGAELYQTVNRNLQAELDQGDEGHRYQLISRLCSIYRTAQRKKLPTVAADLKAFAFGRFPEVLKRDVNNYQSNVGNVANTLRDLAGARDALAFLIERLEQEPTWFRYNHRDGWNQHGWSMARWRTEAGALGDLEDRLLRLVTAELRRELESRQSRNRVMYYCQHTYYWKEKEADFRKTAEQVYAERADSGAAVRYIADYLYDGLHHYDRAIEILFVAHNDKLLDEGAQARLVEFLHWQQRFGESIAVLKPLVEWRPDTIRYRTQLMHAYFRTGRPAELRALLQQTDEHFHQEGRWTEDAMAALAYSCLENELFQQSVDYYDEVIPLHQRTQPRRGIGNGTLSGYYGHQARAYAGLKDTAKAVDAACGAIISWGPRHEKRADSLNSLNEVLRQAPDLDGYVAQLDRQAQETGLHNPIVRKALGQVYREQEQYAKAIAQLKLACEVQPNDTETHQALVACFDKQGDKEGAIGQVLASLQLSRRDIDLYRDLGKRLESLERPKQTERAYTSIVEMLPHESESHEALAVIRQEQDRWDDAIAHWKQVAAIRALEPTGLLKLAEAQIHQKQWDAAMETLRQLDSRGWPERFGDVHAETRRLERQIEDSRE